MNGIECLEDLVAYLEGMLAPEQAQELREHLKICELCRAKCDAFAQLRERLIRWGRAGGSVKRNQIL